MLVIKTTRYELTVEETKDAFVQYLYRKFPDFEVHLKKGGSFDSDFVPTEDGFVVNVEFTVSFPATNGGADGIV